MGLGQDKPCLFCDSKSAIHLAENHKTDSKIKYKDICYHFIKQMVEEERIQLINVMGKKNLADALTKSISSDQFLKHREKL